MPDDTDGMDITPLFYGGEADTDNRYLYWEFPGKQRAVRHGDWKCVTVKKDAPLELYNIADDPCETNNLAAQQPKMVKELDAVMHSMHKPSVNYPIPEDELVKGKKGVKGKKTKRR